MSLVNWLAIAALLAASYLASLHLSLIGVSISAFQRRLAARDADRAARWLLERFQACILTTSLLRTICRLLFFGLVLVGVAGIGPESALTMEALLLAGGVSVLALWLCSSVIASAIARHAGTDLLVRSLILLKILTWVGQPMRRVLSVVDEVVRRLSGAHLNEEALPGAELLRTIEDAQFQGALDEPAVDLLANVMEFGSTDVGEVMTPRTDIDGIEFTNDLVAIRNFVQEVGHSRIPIYRENLDHIVGILYVKDLVPFLGADGASFRLKPLLRRPLVVPETKKVRELLSDFQQSEVHMAVVIDEYGGTAGLVTIEDILEELVGEIHDEHEPEGEEIPALVTIDELRAEVDGRYHIDDLNEELGLDLPEDDEFDTVGGFVMASLGRVPSVGDTLETPGARFTALEASQTHVQRIGIELVKAAPAARTNGSETENGK